MKRRQFICFVAGAATALLSAVGRLSVVRLRSFGQLVTRRQKITLDEFDHLHLAVISGLISLGSAKITSARSPIRAVGHRAFSGVFSQPRADLYVCGPDKLTSRSARKTLLCRLAIHWRPLEVTLRYLIATWICGATLVK